MNRVKKHRSLGEEELNRIDMHHLSQSALVALLASDWTTLQCHYMPTLEDCKPKIVPTAQKSLPRASGERTFPTTRRNRRQPIHHNGSRGRQGVESSSPTGPGEVIPAAPADPSEIAPINVSPISDRQAFVKKLGSNLPADDDPSSQLVHNNP